MSNILNDFLLRRGVEDSKQIDLKAIFGDAYTSFSIASSDDTAISASIDDNGILTIAGTGEFGFSDLVLTATDAAGNTVTDNFRARLAGENAFTIALLPDTQVYTSRPALNHVFGDQTQWLVDNVDSKNISFVIHLGDVTNWNTPAEWELAAEAMHKLDGIIPYSIAPGNHDYAENGRATDTSSIYLDTLFSPEIQAGISPETFGGTYDQEPDRSINTYHTFAAPDGTKWLVLSLEFGPRDDVLRWAGDVVEDHLDHRVIISSHSLTNGVNRTDTFMRAAAAHPSTQYGINKDPGNVNDGEYVWRELTSKYPNVVMTVSGHEPFTGGKTMISHTQHGNTVVEMLANYQGGMPEILPNKGQIRMLVIDPDNGTISTETYMTETDTYFDEYRDSREMNREGLTGEWPDHQEVITGLDLGTPELVAQAKAGDDLFVAAQQGAANASIELDGRLSLNDSLVETYEWLNADGDVVATDAVAHIDLPVGRHYLTLRVTDRDGKVTTDDKLVVVTGDATRLFDNFNDGDAHGWGVPGGTDNFLVKGSVLGRSSEDSALPAPEGRLYEQSDTENNVLVWQDTDAAAWTDYVFEFTVRTGDNNDIGGAFYWQDADNHYRVVFDGENNTRSLIKVEDGVRTVLAQEAGTVIYGVDQTVKVAVVDGAITTFLNGRLLFGGAVIDEKPLTGGTVGFWSSKQFHSQFDDAMVNDVGLTAHAGDDQLVLDTDGNGTATVSLSANGTFGLAEIVSWAWTDAKGNVRATTADASFDLGVGTHNLTLTVIDVNGAVATDRVDVEVVGKNRQLLVETFDHTNALANWRVVDEGEFGGLGPDGTESDWSIVDGALVQHSDLQSNQMGYGAFTNPGIDIWLRGASPHGSGAGTHRLGTYILYEGEGANEWEEYSISARIETPDDDGLGFLFHYIDDQNYYKLEIDRQGLGNIDTLFMLVEKKDGYERIIDMVPQIYTSGETIDLRVDIVDQKISAYINGDAIFPYAIENHTHQKGTFGLYSWGSEGVSFDNVTVISLAATDPEEPVDTVPTAGYSGNVWLLEGDAVSTKTGQFKFDGGANNGVVTGLSWGPKGGAYDVGNGTTVVPLTSNGQPVTVSHEDQGPLTLIGRDSEGNEVFRLSATPAGEYTVSLSGALDHPDAGLAGAEDALRARVNFTVTDDDGDTASGHIQFDVRDGAPTAAYSGNTWLKERDEVTSRTGQFKFDGGADGAVITALSWGPKGGAYDVGKGTTVVPLTSNGLPVTVSHEDQGPLTLIGRASDGTEIFRISSTETGEYTVTLSGNLDHPADSGEGKDDALRARINFTATDADGDTASGHIQFDIRNGDEVSPYEIVPNEFGGNDIFLHVADALVPELGTDSLDRVFYDGEKADIVLPGTIEQATLLNEANDSNLFGNALDNALTGNDFANIIKGGEGRDVMTGGKGADIFLFDAADQSGIRQIDHVTDFSFGDGDKLVFNDLDVQQQANKSFLFSSVFRDGVLSNGLSNVLSLLTNDVALATTAVAALMSENSVAGFKFDGDWYVVQTGERTNNVSGIQNPLSLLSKNGLNKIVDIAADHLAIENVIEIDLVGTNAIGKLGNVVSYDIAA